MKVVEIFEKQLRKQVKIDENANGMNLCLEKAQ